MKEKISILAIILLFISASYAQKKLSVEENRIKGNSIYLSLNGADLEYSTSAVDRESEIMGDTTRFSMVDGNSCSVYMKWINPLRYRLTWKDTLYEDESDQAISEFTALLKTLFSPSILPISYPESFENFPDTMLLIPKTGFNNSGLMLMYLQLRTDSVALIAVHSKLNSVTKAIVRLDAMISDDRIKEVAAIFEALFALTKSEDVLKTVEDKELQLKKIEESYPDIEEAQKKVLVLLEELDISDQLLDNYFKNVVKDFVEQTKTTLEKVRNLTTKLKPLINIMKNSVQNSATIAGKQNFYRVKIVKFPNGKKFHTSLTITEFEYKKESFEFTKKDELAKNTFIFGKYDPVAISVSTGIFYSNTTLKGYGVSTNTAGEFSITEDHITKNNPVTAAFLNFNFRTGSRYFAPLLQIGLDPTQKRPFLLMGAGFTIPASRIAISGGPIWTWNQTLDKLTLGQSISSTTELEDDIQYKFDVEPKGWYFGIQINF